ncbi:MAG: hypothetical protein WAS54_07590 [Scrofimicrobium sp.]
MAVAAALLIGLITNLLLDGTLAWQIAPIIVMSLLMASAGFAEDLKGLSVKLRIGMQLALSAVLAFWLLSALGISVWWSLPLALVGVFYIDADNFMDGVNGISSFQGIASGAMAVVVGSIVDSAPLMVAGVLCATVFLGFLPWNFPKAKMFLGDSGSYLLGGMTFGLAIMTWAKTVSVLAAIAPMLIYSADVLFTLGQRALRRVDLTESHNEHLYQVVKRKTDSHVIAALYPFGFTVLICTVALLQITGAIALPVAWILVALLVAGYLILGNRLRVQELRVLEVKR